MQYTYCDNHLESPPRTVMSQQLTISSLFSAFALVMLVLFARAGEMVDARGADASLVQVETAYSVDA
ncbi:hypothetical protein MACH24_29450 [Erythrobacter sp. Dej080120_24]|nr:hypothetical protein MACH24_29450 [Erythrobacter sp. Dej080120_24]